ncbi:MAG: NYN domain-containing protein [Chloroflexi bacterium]|nr:NYN domain-containing protein [Chloroflexota bacterium]
MPNSSANADRQVAVLIDFENVGLNSIQWLFDQISDIGRVIVKRAYADWSTASRARDQLLQLGIEPIHLFTSGVSGKNASDIRLAIDAVELLYQAPVDTFVIVSSDSDFVPLVSKLRAAGKTVVGAGRQATVSRTLVLSCDRYFYLDQAEKPPKPAPSFTKRPPEAESILVRAVRAAMDEQGRAVGSKLSQTLQRLDPSFDFRALGYSTFTKYLEASTEVRVTRPRGRGDVAVVLAEVNGSTGTASSTGPEAWGPGVDAAWSKRADMPGQPIPGSRAAADAADVLGVSKLSVSKYKTLQGLLDISELLRGKWRRDRNTIIRQ